LKVEREWKTIGSKQEFPKRSRVELRKTNKIFEISNFIIDNKFSQEQDSKLFSRGLKKNMF